MDMTTLSLAFELMGLGLLGVFSVLILFCLVIWLLPRLFPYGKEDENQQKK